MAYLIIIMIIGSNAPVIETIRFQSLKSCAEAQQGLFWPAGTFTPLLDKVSLFCVAM
jgi:hypothetical protein